MRILCLLFALALPAFGAQQFINVGSTNSGPANPGDGFHTSMKKVNTNFFAVFPQRYATGASHTLPTNVAPHVVAWTNIAVRGTNTLPPAAHGHSTNVWRLILKDEGGNAGSTNIQFVATSGDKADGMATFALSNNWQVIRLYSAGGTNWFTW